MTGQFVGVTGPYSATYDAADVTVTAAEVTGAALSIGDVSVDEPAFGTATATFTVTLSAARTGPVTVDYATSNGTAIAGQDYQAAAGGLTFAPGQTTQTIPVTVSGGNVQGLLPPSSWTSAMPPAPRSPTTKRRARSYANHRACPAR